MPRDKPDPKRPPRPVGRPRTRPAGAKYWAQWVTDEERAALAALLAKMRERPKATRGDRT